ILLRIAICNILKKHQCHSYGLEYFFINETVPPDSGSNNSNLSFAHFNQLFTSWVELAYFPIQKVISIDFQ
ncbi:MAG: hypothetical protein QMB65_00970, partial [Vicingaceae bacterium]